MRMELFMFVGVSHTMLSPSKQNVFVYVKLNPTIFILILCIYTFYIAFNKFM